MNDKTPSKKNAEEQLAYQAALLEYVNDAIISMDLDLVIQSWNKAAELLYGWTAVEAVGRVLADLLRSEYPQDPRDAAIRTLVEKDQYEGEFVHHHKDGTPITIFSSVSTMKDGDGELVGYVAINRDITDRKKAEEALRWWAHVFEHLESGFVIGGENNTLALMNPAFARMHGYTVEELTGEPIASVFAPEARAEVPRHIGIAHDQGRHSFESIHIRKDGSRFPVEINLTAVKNKDGEVLYRVANVFDISEKKRAESELKSSFERYQTLFDTSREGIAFVDLHGRIEMANQAFLDMLGYTLDEVRTLTYKDITPGKWAKLEVDIVDNKVMKDGYSGEYEKEYIHKDGHVFPVQLRVWLIRDNRSEPLRMLGMVGDITEQKESEKALLKTQFAIDHAADAIFWIQPDGEIADVNNAACRYLGYDRDELLAMRVEDIDPLETDWETSWAELKSKGSITVESTHVGKNGRKIPVEVVANYLDYHGREFNCAFVRDITERTTLEAQLRQAQKLETIGTLAGGIAHDFNNILGPILGYSDMLLADGKIDGEIREDLGHILKAAYRAKELVQQILLFSRQSERDRTPVQIHLIVKEALKLIKATMPSTIDIQQEIDRDCDAVMADPTQIHQVFLNLCTNAQHAMREPGGILKVSLKQLEADETFLRKHAGLKDGRYLRLTVSDTGHGINSPHLERIFEPFFTTKQSGEGTGLGLSVAHGIVVGHGGTITVDSQPGRGTSFHVYLPCVVASATPVPSTDIPLAAANESVLYVEDQEDVAAIGRRMLERLGYNVSVVSNGADALNVFREDVDRFDLVLTDQTMPGMTGADLASKLLRIRPRLPIVLMTGYSETATPDSAKRAGIRCFIRKPIVTRELALALREALETEPAAVD